MRFLNEVFCSAANLISLGRLILVFPLWMWAFQGRYHWVGWGLIAALVSDVLDGLAARLLNQCSPLGEKLDSWGDHLILISSVTWLFTVRAEVFPPGRLAWMVPTSFLYLVVTVIGLYKHGQFGGAHILEGKPLALFGYLVIVLAMFGRYTEWIYSGLIVSWNLHSLVNLIHHYHPELFNTHQRSLILGLLGLDWEDGPIRYFFS
jgi:phosphatidylglycerophosphate synthase